MSMRIDFAKFAIPHDATNDELRDWINELFAMWADTSDLLAEYQEGEYVKVVRCRDCVHAEPEGEPPRKGCEGLLWCDYLTEGIGFSVLPHNFCAWGKRKEGGDGLDAS